MTKVEMWFPTPIYIQEDLISAEENEKLKEICNNIKHNTMCGGSDWVGGTYNTHGTHDLTRDDRFNFLLDKISYHVHEFAKMHNSNASYENGWSWLNVSGPSAWQEFHTHNGNVFSAVYYVSAPEGSGKIVFENPLEPDMCPPKEVYEKNQLSYTRIGYPPKEGTLMIFRSFLRHLVEPNTFTKGSRMSIACNFR